MKSILLQLYDGEISPAEQYLPKTEEYRQMRREHCHHYEDFIQTLKTLNPPLNKRFIEIMNEQSNIVSLEMAEIFIDGFRLGTKMMIEVYENDFLNGEE